MNLAPARIGWTAHAVVSLPGRERPAATVRSTGGWLAIPEDQMAHDKHLGSAIDSLGECRSDRTTSSWRNDSSRCRRTMLAGQLANHFCRSPERPGELARVVARSVGTPG